MDSSSLEFEALTSKICDLEWDDFHTLLQLKENVDGRNLELALVGKIIASRLFTPNVVQASLKEFILVEIESNSFLF